MDISSSPSASTTGTGSSIVRSLGTGSGIDTNALVSSLVDINKVPESKRLTTRQTLLETQISDFGLLRNAFSKLETSVSLLANADTFNAKSTSVPTTTLLGITKLDAKAAAGEYSIKVDAIAQAQSLSSGNFASQTAAVGKGTLAIRLGSWTNVNDAAIPPVLNVFSPDATKTGATITIDDGNNSLVGVRDAINKSGIGVKASIVSNAGSFKLLITAPSGATNEVEITATEVGGAGLASFNANNTNKTLTQQQDGKDAEIHVNGISITRASNHLTDVVEGLEFDLFNKSTTETVNIAITEDKSVSEKAVRDFVAAYNTFLTDSGKLVGFNSETNQFGSLRQDPLAKNLLQQVRSQLNAAVEGLTNDFTNLSSLGIRTELNGTLTIDDSAAPTSFRSAIDKNFGAVRDLFTPKSTSTNAQIAVTNHTDKSIAGTYPVVITQQPSKGNLKLGAAITAFDPTPLTTWNTTGKTFTFTAGVDGIDAAPITLPATTYASGADLAADLQTRINADSTLVAAKVGVSVVFNTGTNKLEFTSNAYGSSSKVTFTNLSLDMTEMGFDGVTHTSSNGSDVGGTVGGVAGFGFGNVLLPALGSKAEGLSMRVDAGATSGSIAFSRGFAGSVTRLIDDFLKTSGMIKSRETSIGKEVDKVKTSQKTLDRRSEAYRARLQAQFGAMESIVRGLKSTGTFLTGAFNALQGNSNN